MKDLLTAFSFLTLLPVGRGFSTGEKELARSMAFFPLVGLVIGLLLALGYYLLSSVLPKPLAIWLTIGLLAFLTRGLHLDGFADTMDGLACGGTRERDPRGDEGQPDWGLWSHQPHPADRSRVSRPGSSLNPSPDPSPDPDGCGGKKRHGLGLLPVTLCQIRKRLGQTLHGKPRSPGIGHFFRPQFRNLLVVHGCSGESWSFSESVFSASDIVTFSSESSGESQGTSWAEQTHSRKFSPCS